MFERFTNQSRRVVVLAQEEARMLNHNYIGTEHLLLGLLHEGRGSAARALNAMDVTLGVARDHVVARTGRAQEQPSGHIPFTSRAKKSLELSLREALQLGDVYIGTGHLLLGLIRQDDSVAVKILGELGTDLAGLRARVTRELRDHPEGQDAPAAEREYRRVKLFMRGTVQGLLEEIDGRLSAIEGHLGITRPVPDALRSLVERIAQVRRDKEAAIEAEDFGRAAELRDSEKQLIEERARAEQEIAVSAAAEAAVSAAAAETAGPDDGEAGVLSGEPGELARLRARVARLEERLREHGIDPDEPREPPAAGRLGCARAASRTARAPGRPGEPEMSYPPRSVRA